MARVSTTGARTAVLLREAITRVNRRLRQTRPVADLTIAQISALQSLYNAGALTPRELSDVERVQPPTMTRIVARLEERALVQRTPHPSDGRQVILAPSLPGRRLLEDYLRARDEWLAQRLSRLAPEDRETLRRAADLLNRIARD